MFRTFQAVRLKDIKRLVLSIALPLGVGALSAFFMSDPRGDYAMLLKPDIAPPPWVFGMVWTILYILMGIASYLVWSSDCNRVAKKRATWLYLAQLFVNFFWSILFFNLQLRGLALVWILLLLFLVVLTTVAFYDIRRLAGWLMVPYVAWLSFAMYLNYMIWMLNR